MMGKAQEEEEKYGGGTNAHLWRLVSRLVYCLVWRQVSRLVWRQVWRQVSPVTTVPMASSVRSSGWSGVGGTPDRCSRTPRAGAAVESWGTWADRKEPAWLPSLSRSSSSRTWENKRRYVIPTVPRLGRRQLWQVVDDLDSYRGICRESSETSPLLKRWDLGWWPDRRYTPEIIPDTSENMYCNL